MRVGQAASVCLDSPQRRHEPFFSTHHSATTVPSSSTPHSGATGSSLNVGAGPPTLERWISARKGLTCGSYVTVIVPPLPGEPSKPFRPSEPLIPLLPPGVPLPPEPPRPPSPLPLSAPPVGSPKYRRVFPAADTLACNSGCAPGLTVTRICTGGAFPPFPPSWPFPPSVPFPPFPPGEGLFGSVEPMLPLDPAMPSVPLKPLLPAAPEKFETKL